MSEVFACSETPPAFLAPESIVPLCIDLFCGLGGWTEGFLAEGYRVVGFDIEIRPYPAQLVIQDVLTIHGSQFRDATVIVASPPCQKYSWLAMPWSRSTSEHSQAAKALRRKWETEGPDNRLFDACFRIQREAIEAAGHFIPLIVENVRGAIPWVGRSAWNYGSFHLWGDVPALMPINLKRGMKQNPDATNHPPGSWFRIADSSQGDRGQKVPVYSDPRRNGGKGSHLTSPSENINRLADGIKVPGNKLSENGFNIPIARMIDQSLKPANFRLGPEDRRQHLSYARKAASAQIAKIPFELARHVAAVYYPRTLAQVRRRADAAGETMK